MTLFFVYFLFLSNGLARSAFIKSCIFLMGRFYIFVGSDFFVFKCVISFIHEENGLN